MIPDFQDFPGKESVYPGVKNDGAKVQKAPCCNKN